MDLKSLRSQRGFGLAESLIAAALLMISAIGIMGFLKSSKDLNQKVERSSECRERVTQVLNKFKSSDHKLNAPNWHATSANPTPAPGDLGNHPERINKFSIVDNPANVTWNTTNAWMMTNTSVNWALALYNQFGDVCSATGLGREITAGGGGTG